MFFEILGSTILVYSCPVTTRRLVIAGRPQTNLNETTQVSERNAGVEAEGVAVNIESTDLREQLQSQKIQIQELTER